MGNLRRSHTDKWNDPLHTAAVAKSMTGFSLLDGILKGTIAAAPIAQTLDCKLLSLEKGKVNLHAIQCIGNQQL